MELSKHNEEIKGAIGFYNLSDWWQTEFSDEERKYILEKIENHGFSKEYLLVEDVKHSQNSASNTIATIASFFNSEKNRTIAYRCIEKSEELIDNNTSFTDQHFIYSEKIKIYNKWRDLDSFAYSEAIEACYYQIEISEDFIKEQVNAFDGIMPLPSHIGYKELSISLENRSNFDTAINLSSKALNQGWAGDWPNRIQRCHEKINN